MTTLLLCLLTAYLGTYTHILNRNLWHDQKAFFAQEVSCFGNQHYASDLAEILYQEGDHQGAEEHFRRAVRERQASAKDLVNFSSLLIDEGRCEEALSNLEKAQTLQMGFEERAELHNNAGMASFRLNRPTEALIQFKKAVIYSPKKALFWANLAGAYGNTGDYPNCAAAFRRGLEIDPRSLALRKGLALTFINMRNYTGAISILEEIPSEFGDGQVKLLLDESRSKLNHFKDRQDEEGSLE